MHCLYSAVAASQIQRLRALGSKSPPSPQRNPLTRDTALILDPESAWGEDDQGYEEQEQSEHQPGDPAAKNGKRDRPVLATPETVPQSANFDSLQRQHTPAHVPHSKQAKTPESGRSLRDRLRDSSLTEEDKAALVRENFVGIFSITGPASSNRPTRSPNQRQKHPNLGGH